MKLEFIANRYSKLLGLRYSISKSSTTKAVYFDQSINPEDLRDFGGFSMWLDINSENDLVFQISASFLDDNYRKLKLINPSNKELIDKVDWYKEQCSLYNNLDAAIAKVKQDCPDSPALINHLKAYKDNEEQAQIERVKRNLFIQEFENKSDRQKRICDLLRNTADLIEKYGYGYKVIHEVEDLTSYTDGVKAPMFVGCRIMVSDYMGG